MSKGEIFVAVVAVVYALIFCSVGILCRKVDIFSKLNHPLVKRHPNISKTFGTGFICFAFLWLFLVFFIINC